MRTRWQSGSPSALAYIWHAAATSVHGAPCLWNSRVVEPYGTCPSKYKYNKYIYSEIIGCCALPCVRLQYLSLRRTHSVGGAAPDGPWPWMMSPCPCPCRHNPPLANAEEAAPLLILPLRQPAAASAPR
jgi:hypothetical protein